MKRDSGSVYAALEAMRKDTIIELVAFNYMRAKRDILTVIHHPYVVTLRYSFQTSHEAHLIMDLVNGGRRRARAALPPGFGRLPP